MVLLPLAAVLAVSPCPSLLVLCFLLLVSGGLCEYVGQSLKMADSTRLDSIRVADLSRFHHPCHHGSLFFLLELSPPSEEGTGYLEPSCL